MRTAWAVGLGVLLGACSTSAQPAKQPGPSDVVATVGSAAITLAQVDERALQQPASNFGGARLMQALYLARRAALDEMVGNRLLDDEAKGRGIDRATLVEREITAVSAIPTEAEILAWYQANSARVQGAALDQVRAPIKTLLLEQRMESAREAFIGRLKAKTTVKILLEPPRQKVADGGRAAKGPANAPVQIVEFSDFQCPFCQRAAPVVEQVLKAYGDRVRLTYRHYPLPNHPNARPAANAAICAEEQGRFWQYHDQLFSHPNRLTDDDLKEHAKSVGLDAQVFANCVTAGKSAKGVDADIRDADAAGVSGTPAFFINGRPLEGAQPFEVFKQIIDEELALR